jgi:hypothetical protein
MHVELEQERVLKFSEAIVRFCYLVRLADRSETILDPLKHGRAVVVSATPLWRAAVRQQSGNSDQHAQLWVNPHEETMCKKAKQQF